VHAGGRASGLRTLLRKPASRCMPSMVVWTLGPRACPRAAQIHKLRNHCRRTSLGRKHCTAHPDAATPFAISDYRHDSHETLNGAQILRRQYKLPTCIATGGRKTMCRSLPGKDTAGALTIRAFSLASADRTGTSKHAPCLRCTLGVGALCKLRGTSSLVVR
jgi:hypothetical protein